LAEDAPVMKRLAILGIGLGLLAVAGVLVVLVLLNWTPQFYEQAALSPGEDRELESKQFLNRAGQLANDVRTQEQWEAVFSEDQINAWLAEEFAELAARYASVESAGLEAPRVSLGSGEVLIGITRRGRWLAFVVWARAQIWMAEPGKVAVRVRDLRVGALPFPISRIRELAETIAQRSRATIEWRQVEGDPVALVNLDMHDALSNLRRIDVGDGRFLVSSAARADVADPVQQAGSGAR
jgi:hypothetical protein